MKKQMVKLIALVVVVVLGCAGITVIANDNITETEIGTEINPCFTAIHDCSRALVKENSLGKLYIEACTITYQGYKGSVKVELQHYDGGWNTIKTWTDEPNSTFAGVGKYYYVDNGSYQLKVTHKALNSNGTTAETFTAYSDVVTF